MAGADFIRTVAAAALGRFDQVADWLGLASGKEPGPGIPAAESEARRHQGRELHH
jgi:hypothetical protein